jgi:plastocyanin
MLVCILFLSCSSLAAGAGEKEKIFRATVGDDGMQRVEVMGGSYFFNPNHIIVKVNVPVELIVRKESGIVPHNIVIKAPEAGVDFDVAMTSDPKVIRFTPTKVGTYPIYCSKKLLFFESHREKGMEGVLEVVE